MTRKLIRCVPSCGAPLWYCAVWRCRWRCSPCGTVHCWQRPTPARTGALSAAGRANATACTLYAAEHVTKVPLGSNSVWDGGWTAGTMDGSALARARRTLRAPARGRAAVR